LDATAEGSFMSLTPRKAKAIMAKTMENQNWTFNTQKCHESEEVLEDLCTLSTKMDVLLSWLEQREIIKEIVKPFKMHIIFKINMKKI